MENTYKKMQKTIDHYCFIFSQYFNIDIEDLYSEANFIIFNSFSRYTYEKYDIYTFLKMELYNKLKYFCLYTLRRQKYEMKLKSKLLVNSKFSYEMKIKNKIQIDSKIEKTINHIIDFLLEPNFMEILNPFINITKQKKIKPSAYIVKKYFNKVFGYTYQELDYAIEGIRTMLKEEAI